MQLSQAGCCLPEELCLKVNAASGVCIALHESHTYDSAAAVSAIYPFFSHSHAWLLLMVVFLGMFSGLAFGSSYQLVSKFPTKNSAALTLGAPRFGLPLPCPISNFMVLLVCQA